MDHQPPRVPLSQLALRFISGKFQGSEYALSDSGEMLVGRSGDVQIVLVEDMVSRRHARIAVRRPDGSRSRTSARRTAPSSTARRSSARISRRAIASSSAPASSRSSTPTAPRAARRRNDDGEACRRTQARTMTGAIEEIPLPDVLQLLGSSKKTGVLVIQSAQGVGRLRMRKGIIVHASIDDLESVRPLKCAYRILAWTHGTFELEPADENPVPGEIELRRPRAPHGGAAQMDEYNHLRANPPGSLMTSAPRALPHPLLPPLREGAAALPARARRLPARLQLSLRTPARSPLLCPLAPKSPKGVRCSALLARSALSLRSQPEGRRCSALSLRSQPEGRRCSALSLRSQPEGRRFSALSLRSPCARSAPRAPDFTRSCA
jgi:hypothetical protein